MEKICQTINDVTVELFNAVLVYEKKALIVGEFSDITTNDMHIIEAIGVEELRNMSTIARKLSVTVGSLTTAMNSLVRKGYVSRERSEEDRRVVFIKLTEKGIRAYEHHRKFHEMLVSRMVVGMDREEAQALSDALIHLRRVILNEDTQI